MAALLAHMQTRKVRVLQLLAFGSSEVVPHRLLTPVIQWEPVHVRRGDLTRRWIHYQLTVYT